MGEMGGVDGILVGNLRERDHLEVPRVDEGIILRFLGSGIWGHGLD
jgi:hypothetical protein